MTELMQMRSTATPQVRRSLKVDRENLVIRDVVAMKAFTEALGHGMVSDMKTIQMMKRLADQKPNGIRSRFGHPGMSENAMGRKIAIARNFRIRGDALIHDLHLLESARKSPVFSQDPLEYIMDMAENHPSEIAESVVMRAERVWVLEDGREVPFHAEEEKPDKFGNKTARDRNGRPLAATTDLPVIRPVKFYFVDLVSEGALTHDGLFEPEFLAEMFSDTSSEYAQLAFEFMDRFRQKYHIPLEEVPRKVNRLVSTYIFARSHEEKDMARKSNEKFEAEVPEVTLDTAPAEDVVAPEVEDKLDDELDAALETAEEIERRQQESVDEVEAEPVSEEASTEERSLAAAFKRIEQLEAENAAWSVRFEKLLRLTVQNTRNIEALDRNVRRIDGDPVVTYSISKAAPQGSLEPLQFEAPRPPLQALATKPKHLTERFADPLLNADFDVDPELATFAAMVQRQKALQGVK